MIDTEKVGKVRVEPRNVQPRHRPITSPATRDGRQYVDVVRGARNAKNQERPQKTENRGYVRMNENLTTCARLRTTVILVVTGEVDGVLPVSEVAEKLDESNMPIMSASLLTPNSLILFLQSEEDVLNVLDDSSLLWSFGNPSRWSDNWMEKSRTIWVECEGIHPKWLSLPNMVTLGERWGTVLKVEHDMNGINSLTWARLLIKTERKERIEETVNVRWESGSCQVRVKEGSFCRCGKEVRDSFENDDMEVDNSEDGDASEGGMAIVDAKLNNDDGGDIGNLMGQMACMDQNEENTRPSTGTVAVEHGTINASESIATGVRNCDDEFEVDDYVGGPMSCPVEYRSDPWFDPIASVECSIGLGGVVKLAKMDGGDGNLNRNVVTTPILQRPRGRPRRLASSLPDTLSVPSTPLTCTLEAHDTWNTAKEIGVNDKDETAVMDELRRSKRVQRKEATHRT